MKVLFLDVDGVLNSEAWFSRHKDPAWNEVDPAAVALVNDVLENTGAKLVLSSTWRLVAVARDELRAAGLPIAGATPRIDTNNRGEEIRAWLDNHPGVTHFAIFDDDSDAGDCGLREHFIQTSWKTGLQIEHAVEAIRLLGVKAQDKVA